MFYLIGVQHSVQSIPVKGLETPYHTEYRACLEQAIRTYKPAVVGEEYSQDSLNRAAYREPQEFFTKEIAEKAGVKHMLCDPDFETRKTMSYQSQYCWSLLIAELWHRIPDSERDLLSRGLEIVKDIPLREQYWLNELKPVLQNDIIFVCGDSHIDSFAELLGSQKIVPRVIKRKIGMTPELIQQADEQIQFAKANRDRIEEIYKKIEEENGGTIPSPCYASLLG